MQLSIVIPTYDEEATLEEIVVGDWSCDRTVQVAQKLAAAGRRD